ncbi:ABC transporter permease subunit [Halonotius roseus]|uniref:PrsW family intramembrane metalloprotease n=1 Tax=Halonotius roseus TaxID=2511997 RepID=A0A544QKX5_9EURY|nr:ABC transporter permease subunit [Halonotius roseus]TQQ79020.1 PrsW family intramembrane metalloprotease [Halonotius roseus]
MSRGDRLRTRLTTIGRRLRRIGRIARWEIGQSTNSYNRRTLAVVAVLVVLVGSVGASAVALGVASPAPNTDIYRVGVAADSPYNAVIEDNAALTARTPSRSALATGEIDLLVGGVRQPTAGPGPRSPTLLVEAADGEKGAAALTAFRSAVQSYNDRAMALEANQTAAYPVIVELQYLPQSTLGPAAPTNAGNLTDGTDGSEGDADEDTDTEPDANDTANGTSGSSDGDTAGSGDSTAGTDDADGDAPPVADGGGGSLLDRALFGGGTSGSPAEIQPPFPFGSLLLAFLFLVPMNFVIQSYGSSVLNERISRRGELLLVAPVERLDIVAGKTLPYAAIAVAVTAVIAAAVGGGLLSVAAVVPIALTFLAATFLGAMFARSFKELTFVTITITVFLTSYVFIPSIFTNVTPIALISPLTLVVMELQGEAVSLGSYLFSTGPFYTSTAVLFLLGTGVYREEDMFSQKPVPLKFLDALDARLSGVRSVGVLTALFLPLVFIAELLAIAVLFVLPIEVSIPLLLVVIAAVEEVAKSIHIFAGFESDRFDRSASTALVLGAASGVGFFVAEKFTVVAQLVGLPDLQLGQAALQPAGIGITPSTTLLLLAGPLVLHTVTAGVSALGARKRLRWYLVSLVAATAIHAAYNLGVVTLYG